MWWGHVIRLVKQALKGGKTQVDERGESICPVCGETIAKEAAQESSGGLVQCGGCMKWVMPEDSE